MQVKNKNFLAKKHENKVMLYKFYIRFISLKNIDLLVLQFKERNFKINNDSI